jgi:malate synthase
MMRDFPACHPHSGQPSGINQTSCMSSLSLTEAALPQHREILSAGALDFVTALAANFQPALEQLLQNRERIQQRFDHGQLPDFLPETQSVRESPWKVRAIPADLLDRRVEITGPTDRKMVINALNADVKVFMADFEDALSPTWFNVLDGQLNLRDANCGQISYDNPETGKHYALKKNPALLIARVRGLHLPEKHVLLDGRAIPGCLFDFALYFYHNYQIRLRQGSGVYFYLPKMQSYLEARWWHEVFQFTEKHFALPSGSIRATVLIETLPAVFQMDEILYELRDYIVGLNCGRWDYIFSYIKTLRNHKDRILPDRQSVTMDKPFLNAYSRLLIKTCHKRGAFAMGGMAAFIPLKDPAANEKVLAKVRADKQREADNGHDGTWVAHPGLASTAMEIFNAHLGNKKTGNKSNQLDVLREQDAPITAADLLQPSEGECTEEGMRLNIRIALQYIEAWIRGLGCVPIYGLMEDAATAEISRTSIWQWIRHGVTLSNGKLVTKDLFKEFLQEEMMNVRKELGEEKFAGGKFERAAGIFIELNTRDTLADFLTVPAYRELT